MDKTTSNSRYGRTRMFNAIVAAMLGLGFGATAGRISAQAVKRPSITGIALVQIYVTNPKASEKFYEKELGLAAESSGCNKELLVCLVLNDHQQIQLVEAPSPVPGNLIAKITFATPDVEKMRSYLLSKGLKPNAIGASEKGVRHFTLHDPEGHAVSFVQLPAAKPVGKPANQISSRIIHAGFIVHDRQAEDHFYEDILGFHLYWQGGMKDNVTNWVSMQVPDGTDWIEYMLNVGPDASHHSIGIMNHIALGVANIQTAKQELLRNGGKLTEEPKLGRDGKWQLNVFDPDDTRVEFMEFKPVEKPCCSEFTGTHPSPQ